MKNIYDDFLAHPNTLKHLGNNATAKDLYALGGKFAFLPYENLVKLLRPNLFYHFIKDKSELLNFMNALNHSYCQKNELFLSLIDEQDLSNNRCTAYIKPQNNVISFNSVILEIFNSMQKSQNIYFPGMIFASLMHENEHSIQLFNHQWKSQPEKGKYNFIHDTKRIDDFCTRMLEIDMETAAYRGYQPKEYIKMCKWHDYLDGCYYGSPYEMGARERALKELLNAAIIDPENKRNMFSNLIIESMYELNTNNFQYYLSKQLGFVANSPAGNVLLTREIDNLMEYMTDYYAKAGLIYDLNDSKNLEDIIKWSEQSKDLAKLYLYEKDSPKTKEIEENYSKILTAEMGATISPFKERNVILGELTVQTPTGLQINPKRQQNAAQMLEDGQKFCEELGIAHQQN